jgi:hypothetical protein
LGAPKHLKDYYVGSKQFFVGLVESNDLLQEPQSFSEAINSPQAQEWWGAICDEHQSLIKNKSLINLPTHRKPMSCKWVCKMKTTSA